MIENYVTSCKIRSRKTLYYTFYIHYGARKKFVYFLNITVYGRDIYVTDEGGGKPDVFPYDLPDINTTKIKSKN